MKIELPTEDELKNAKPFDSYEMFRERKRKLINWHRIWYLISTFPRTVYQETKWFIQRGRRGYADCDVWSIDYYLESWLPGAIKQLKETSHGIPVEMFPDSMEISDEQEKEAREKWHAILDKMIDGLEASKRIGNPCAYDDEIGIPLEHDGSISREEWKNKGKEHYQKMNELIDRDVKIKEEGFQLLIKYWSNLWD